MFDGYIYLLSGLLSIVLGFFLFDLHMVPGGNITYPCC